VRNIPGLGRTWYASDDKDVVIDVYDENGALKLITGATAKFMVFRGESVVFAKGMGEGVTVSGSSITVPILSADTAGLGGTSYEVLQYECEVTDIAGNVSTVARGLFTVTADLIP
jgi:hypothetical protein